MTVQEIVNKVNRNGDTRKYRQILAELNDLPVSVINAVLDEDEMPSGYSVINGEIKKTNKVYKKPKVVKPKQTVEQELSNSIVRIKGLQESIKKQEEKIQFKEKELALERNVLKRMQRDLKTEEDINDRLCSSRFRDNRI